MCKPLKFNHFLLKERALNLVNVFVRREVQWKQMCLNKTYLIVMMLLFFQLSFSQNFGEITGKVTLNNNKPLLGASVYFDTVNAKGAITDVNGFYTIKNIPEGSYTVVYSYVGATTVTKDITIIKDQKVTLHVNLTEDNTLEEVVVSVPGSRLQKDLVVNVEKQPLTKIYKATSTTLAESITNLNGVSQNGTGTSIGKPVIRGLTSNRVVTYAQGTRIENQQWGAEHGLGVSSIGVKSVEVIKGPASLLYGSDAIGGVLYFVDEGFTPKSLDGFFETAYFSNARTFQNRIGVKSGLGSFKFNIFGGYTSSGDYQSPQVDNFQGNRVFNTRFDERTTKVAFGWSKNEFASKLTYSYLNNFFGIPSDTPFVSDFVRDFTLPFQDVTQHNLAWENNFRLAKKKASLILGYSVNDRQEFNEVQTTPDLHLYLQILSYNFKVSDILNSDYFNLTIGAQGLFQDNENRGAVFLIPDGTSVENGVFSLLNVVVNDKLTFQSGLRFDSKNIQAESVVVNGVTNFSNFNETFNNLNYSFGTKYQIKDFSFRFNIASGYRSPNVSELLSNGEHGGVGRIEVGDQNLESESATQFDFAINYQKRGLKVIINPFLNAINDYIFIAPTGEQGEGNLPVFAYLQENATLYGGEINFNYQPTKISKLSLQSAVALTFGNNDGDDNPLPFIPPVNFNSRVTYSFNLGNHLKLNSGYLQVQNFLEQNRIAQEELPNAAYSLINLGFDASYKDLILNVAIKNLFDTQYTDHLSRLKTLFENVTIPNPGRDIVINATYKF